MCNEWIRYLSTIFEFDTSNVELTRSFNDCFINAMLDYVVLYNIMSYSHVQFIQYNFFVIWIHTCELFCISLDTDTHMDSWPNRGPPHTRARYHTSLASISYAYTTWQIIFVSLPKANHCPQSGCRVLVTLRILKCNAHRSRLQGIIHTKSHASRITLCQLQGRDFNCTTIPEVF